MAQAEINGQAYGPYGDETVLLVIDVQNGVVEEVWDRDGLLDRLATLIDGARSNGTPVVYVQHETPDDDELRPGTEPWKIHDLIAPQNGEPVVAKWYTDAFVETTLPETLAGLNAGHLVISGAQTDACIRWTVHRAMGLGYDVTLVSDCHTTNDCVRGEVDVTGEQIVKHFNLAIRWSEYPGQRVEVRAHTEIG